MHETPEQQIIRHLKAVRLYLAAHTGMFIGFYIAWLTR